MEEMIGFEGLGDLAIHIILSKLDPNDTARVCCVSKRFKGWASDDVFWCVHSSNDLNLSSPVDPSGKPVPSFKVAYQLWREAFSMYPWTLLKRVKRCWDTLKSWLASNFPEVLASLRKGASEEELNELEKSLKVKLPLPTRLLYRLHDGQECYSDKFLGVIGGYFVYNHWVNVSLLPIRQVILETKDITDEIGLSGASKYISVAASVTGSEKFFSLNCANNQLYVSTANLRKEGEMMPCVPNSLLKSNGNQQSDGLLLWLEEHGRRLQSGMIAVREGDFKSICQFPEKPPLCSLAVTNGVQVRASAVLVPEQSDFQRPVFVYAYSIRMSLLPDGCTAHGMKFNSCQLHRRHWIIREKEVVKSDINGEAVIGMYPLLRPGEKEFVYESCSTQETNSGSIEGSFTFVPGSLVAPKSDPFEAEVARFPLVMPEYIF